MDKIKITNTITKKIDLFVIFSKIFLFGSFLNNIKFDDVDMILVYDNTINLETIKNSKTEILNYFSDLNIHLDLTILSEEELLESDILSKVTYKRIK